MDEMFGPQWADLHLHLHSPSFQLYSTKRMMEYGYEYIELGRQETALLTVLTLLCRKWRR